MWHDFIAERSLLDGMAGAVNVGYAVNKIERGVESYSLPESRISQNDYEILESTASDEVTEVIALQMTVHLLHDGDM